jgi:hypothetical protein
MENKKWLARVTSGEYKEYYEKQYPGSKQA